MLPLCGTSGNVPVVSSCGVFDGSPAGGKVWVQQQVLVCPDVVCRDTKWSTSVLQSEGKQLLPAAVSAPCRLQRSIFQNVSTCRLKPGTQVVTLKLILCNNNHLFLFFMYEVNNLLAA